MVTKVQKWGNGLAFRIPKAFTLEAQLENDCFVELTMIENQNIITPATTPKWNLEELLAGINNRNIHGEVDSGKAHLA